ncbi:MAG: CCA tRNA nucleotidyltransferase [Candidatus Diapherotrites archaeon]|nr:CCA tRNA nucleotidyltransferase [Candidatus Diapherotrites archaeon]
MLMKQLLAEILQRVKPTKNELSEEKRVIRALLGKIKKIRGKHVGAAVYGSVGRGTQLAGDRDIDIFVMFPKELSREEFETEGLRIAKTVFRGHPFIEAYSEHPYLKCDYNGFDIEIIPAYRVSHPRHKLSAVDRTPFHHRYLQQRLSARQKDDVRLLKKFFKGIGVYGADVRHNGFSGYATELLILQYKTFPHAVARIAKWRTPVIIDHEHRQSPSNLVQRYANAPLILIDPTDEQRNVGAAVTDSTMRQTIAAAKAFLKKPDARFFFPNKPKAVSAIKLSKQLRRHPVLGLETAFDPHLHEDIFWGQLQHFTQKIAHQFAQHGFEVERFECYSDHQRQSVVFFELNTLKLPMLMQRTGPPVDNEPHVQRFLETHRGKIKKQTVRNGHVLITVPRENTDAVRLFKRIVAELIKTEKKPIQEILAKHHRVLDESSISEKYAKPTPFRDFATRFIYQKPIWKN